MTVHLKTPPSSSWSLQTSPHWSASFRTVTSLLTDRQEVKEMAVWHSLTNMDLNTLKSMEMIVDFRRSPHPALSPLTIMTSFVTAVESFRYLGTTMYQDLKWDNHIESNRGRTSFTSWGRSTCHRSCWYSSTLPSSESVLCTSITVWFSSATKSDLRRLRG